MVLYLRVPYGMELVKPLGKRPLERLRWKDSIRIDLREIGINTRNWVD